MDYKEEEWTCCPEYYCFRNKKDREGQNRCTIGRNYGICKLSSEEDVLRVNLTIKKPKKIDSITINMKVGDEVGQE